MNEFKTNFESMDALIASIESAIDDAPETISRHELSKLIANRIVGSEK